MIVHEFIFSLKFKLSIFLLYIDYFRVFISGFVLASLDDYIGLFCIL